MMLEDNFFAQFLGSIYDSRIASYLGLLAFFPRARPTLNIILPVLKHLETIHTPPTMPVIGAPKGHNRYRDPKTFQMTPALYRVRQPFFWRNFAAFFIVGAVPLSVYMYTWNVLSKDDFSDIPIPPISNEELAKLREEYDSKK